MRWDSPFFTLELRRRRSRFRLYNLATGAAALACIPTLAATLGTAFGWKLGWLPVLWTAITASLLVCAVSAGLVGASLVFALERREGTLDSLRLLPIPMLRWLTGKLLFPGLLILILPIAAMPGLLAASVQGLIPVDQALSTLAYLLAMGYFWLMTGLWYQEHTPRRKEAELNAASLRPLARDIGESGPHLPRFLLGMFAPFLALLPGQLDRFGNTAFFNGRISHWWVIGAALITGSVAVFANTRGTLAETPTSIRNANATRWLGFAVEVFLIGGLLWRHPWGISILGIMLVWPLWLLIPARSTLPKQQHVNRRLEEELVRLEARFPNPIFLSNVRFHFRRGSLRGRVLGSLVGLLLIVALLALVWTVDPSPMPEKTGRFIAICSGLFIMPWFFIPQSRTGSWWYREQDATQLSLTPLSSQEWIEGEVIANFLANLCRYWNVTLVMGGCLLWLATTPYWGVTLPGLLTMITVMTLGQTLYSYPPAQPAAPELRQQLQRSQSRLNRLVGKLLLVTIAAVTFGALGSSIPWMGYLGAALALAGLPFPRPIIQARIQHQSEFLEHLRRGEMTWNAPIVVGK